MARNVFSSIIALGLVPGAMPLESTEPPPEDVEACLVERVQVETGREFDFFLACCMALGLSEEECREHWAGQVPGDRMPLEPPW